MADDDRQTAAEQPEAGGGAPGGAAPGEPGGNAPAGGDGGPQAPAPSAGSPAGGAGSGAPAPPGAGRAAPGDGSPRGTGSRSTSWGAATATYVVVVVAVLVAINLVGSRIKTSWDLTANHHLTLTQASKNIVSKLKSPVQIIAFEQPGDLNGPQIKSLLQQYASASHDLISYQIVDPAAQPALAARYQITAYGTVIVQSGTNTQTVQATDMETFTSTGTSVFDGEGAITNAIIRAASPIQFTVDFLTGDGEPDAPTQLPDAVQALKDQGYTVGSLNLLASSAGVPKDVSTLIVLTPQQDLAPSEITALKTYAQNGGHLLFMIDPTTKPLPHLAALLKGWGITLQEDLAIDTVRHYESDPTSIAPTIGTAPLTQPLQQAHLAVLLIAAQGLTIASSTPGYTVTPFLTTSSGNAATGGPNSWGIGDLASLQQNPSLAYDAKRDVKGPLTLAATVVQNLSAGSAASGSTSSSSATSATTAASLGQQQFRAVVFGDSEFIASSSTSQANGPINVQGNKDLFLNAVGWLTGRQEGIAVRPHTALDTSLFLTGGKQRALMYTFLLGLPLVCFALAFSTWWSRRAL